MKEKIVTDLLIEILSEEIPASYQQKALSIWQRQLPSILKRFQLDFEEVQVKATPRRLYTVIKKIDCFQAKTVEELRGPPKKICFEKSSPTTALKGFASKVNKKYQEIEFKEIKGNEYAFALVSQGGLPLEQIIGELLEALLKVVKFAKSMHWGDGSILYARPIRQILIMMGDKAIVPKLKKDFKFIQEIDFKKTTLYRDKGIESTIKISSPISYEQDLKKVGIIADDSERKRIISKSLQEKGREQSLKVDLDEALINEVNFLVEVPRVVVGTFPEEFLDLPEIVLTSEMKEHQRYFPTYDTKGKLSNSFFILANNQYQDDESNYNIASGNEKVLRARLEDGSFFYHEDRKVKLIDRVDKLKRVIFLEALGSVFDKKERMKFVASKLLNLSGYSLKHDLKDLHRACDLAKADLTTKLVFEFEHLQGEIGRIYATQDKEKSHIADAILEHYLPRNSNDELPSSPLGVVLSLTEKLDNIISGFLAGRRPTSSQDPLALRRQSLYFIEILIKEGISIDLGRLIEDILPSYPQELIKKLYSGKHFEVREDLWMFFRSRIATIFEKEGFEKSLTRAALNTESRDIHELYLKLNSLKELQKDKEFIALISSFKRMSNILEDYMKKLKTKSVPENISKELLKLKEEKNMFELGSKLEKTLEDCMAKKGSYDSIFRLLANSKSDVDSFFDNVMVMCEDVSMRNNRAALLNFVVSPVRQLLDLSEIS